LHHSLKNLLDSKFTLFIFAKLKCFGIFAPLKIKVVEIKKKITKRAILKLAIFVAVIGVASLFDFYFDKNQEELEEIQAQSKKNTNEQNSVYLISQTSTIGVKVSIQNTLNKKLLLKSQDKFIQKYHLLRNYQVLKAEVQTQTTPLILSYHYLAFKNYYFSDPDDDPLIA